MLAASPHRGLKRATAAHGRCTLGVSYGENDGHAGVAVDGEYAVAFSGKLDNFRELVAAVESPRLAAQPTAAAAIAAAWRLLGETTPNRLRGCFAVAVTDGTRVWLFRDHFGNSSLFYHDDARGLYAATEPRQVIAGAQIPREPDLDVLRQFFFLRYLEDRSASWFKRISRVLISELLIADGGTVSTRRYWDPGSLLETLRPSGEQIAADFARLMTQAVERTLDGSTVISLSGGIDSAAVAAFAAPMHLAQRNARIAALSAVYPSWPSADESQYIRMIADALQIDLNTYQPVNNPYEGLGEWADILDGPVPRAVAIHEFAEYLRRARALGFRTVLNGESAESINDSRAYLVPHLLHRGRFRAALQYLRARRAAGTSRRALAGDVLSAVIPRALERGYWRLRSRKDRPIDWLDSGVATSYGGDAWTPPGERWRRNQLRPIEASGIVYEALEMCQAVCGVRVREPWADVDLWQYFLSLPAETRFVSSDPRPKALFRNLLRGRLPDAIIDRVDKPNFSGYYQARIDYEVLRRWLNNPKHHVRGVRYDVLADHLTREDLSKSGWMWARDLAALHAFLSQW